MMLVEKINSKCSELNLTWVDPPKRLRMKYKIILRDSFGDCKIELWNFLNKDYSYLPQIKFDGVTECFSKITK